MPTLDRIEIEGFKSIRKTAVDLRPVNVLIGANGAGKSNFIGVFGLLQRMMEGRLQLHVAQAGGANSLLRFGVKRTGQLRVRLEFSQLEASYETVLVPTANDSLIFAQEGWQTLAGDWGLGLPPLSRQDRGMSHP